MHDITGRVAVVLGGAFGIGYEVSRAFALHGARVIMIGRKEEHGDAAIESIKKEGGAETRVEWQHCDLESLKEVREVFTGIREREDRLDLLVCCAGINANKYGEDVDGIDRHFGLNWLGQFYVCNLLYPLMRKTSRMVDAPPPRILFESSELHRMAPTSTHFGSFEEINDPSLDPTQLYARTKLAMILGAKALVEKVNTEMQSQWKEAYPGLLGKLIYTAMVSSSRNVEQGSFCTLYAATSPEIEEKDWNGYYFTDPGQLGKESTQASDRNLQAALWDLSQRLIRMKLGEDALVAWDT